MGGGWLSAALAEKIPERVVRNGLGSVHRTLTSLSRGLQAEWEFSTRHGWLGVKARGEDAEAFVNLLRARFGVVPVQLSMVEKWDVVKGFASRAGRVGFGVYVDLGVLEPSGKDGLFPLHRMRAQLADGELKSCRQILEQNAIVDFFPLRVLVTDVQGERISLELSDESREMFMSWRSLPFDRVVAVGATLDQVENAVTNAGLEYDVIRIEPLSLFCECLVCKMGTEAPGVIAKVGKRLPGVDLAAYGPVRKRFESAVREDSRRAGSLSPGSRLEAAEAAVSRQNS